MLSESFAEFIWTHSDLCFIWWKFYAYHSWRENPADLAATWVAWLEKAITSVPKRFQAPFCFLGIREKGSRILPWLLSRAWQYENVINLLCRTVIKPNWFYFPYSFPSHSIFPSYYMSLKDRNGVWLCSHGLMYSARHIVPKVYGMTHTLTWRSRRLWQFIGFNSWECSPTASQRHIREKEGAGYVITSV